MKQRIPVYITYQTAFVDDSGKPQTRADIYGLDRDINNLLHGERRNADVPIARNYNSGSKPVMSSVETTGHGFRTNSRALGYNDNPGYTSWGPGSDFGWNLRSAYQPADRNKVQ